MINHNRSYLFKGLLVLLLILINNSTAQQTAFVQKNVNNSVDNNDSINDPATVKHENHVSGSSGDMINGTSSFEYLNVDILFGVLLI